MKASCIGCAATAHFGKGGKPVRRLIKAAATLTSVLALSPAIAGWEPTKPVEIVVAAGAGGASDQMARMMQAAIQKNNLMKQPLVVSLKGGASGAEALMYMKSSEGDPNKVLIAYSLIYMLPLSAKIPFNWRDLTPVAVVALDQFVLWDNVEGPKTVKDFIEAANAVGIPMQVLHRVAAMASGGMDTLPHNGAVITLLAVTGLTHRESYKDIFAVTILKTAAVFVIIGVYEFTGLY